MIGFIVVLRFQFGRFRKKGWETDCFDSVKDHEAGQGSEALFIAKLNIYKNMLSYMKEKVYKMKQKGMKNGKLGSYGEVCGF